MPGMTDEDGGGRRDQVDSGFRLSRRNDNEGLPLRDDKRGGFIFYSVGMISADVAGAANDTFARLML